MLMETLASFIASLGFGIVFNIRGKKLFFAAIGGGVSWFVYALALRMDATSITALFLSSVTFSVYSEIFARILKTPVTTLIVICLIPLVPGAGMYNTMYAAVTGNASLAIETGLNTLASAGILALGVIMISTIVRHLNVTLLAPKKSRKSSNN